MGRYLIILLILFLNYNQSYSQKTKLTILGQYDYEVENSSCGSIFAFKKQNNKLEQIKDSIHQLSPKLDLVYENLFINRRGYTKCINIKNIEKIYLNDIYDLLIKNKLKVELVYFNVPPHEYIKEDDYSILALKDAIKKADFIAKHINHKVSKILNIDDDTSSINSVLDDINLDTEHGQMVYKFIIMLYGGPSQFRERISEPRRISGYNILATFELRPL